MSSAEFYPKAEVMPRPRLQRDRKIGWTGNRALSNLGRFICVCIQGFCELDGLQFVSPWRVLVIIGYAVRPSTAFLMEGYGMASSIPLFSVLLYGLLLFAGFTRGFMKILLPTSFSSSNIEGATNML